LNINKEYTFKGSRVDFFQQLENLSSKRKLFHYKKSECFEDEFKIIANTSFGTGRINNKSFDKGITIYAYIDSESDNRQSISLKTETRLEVSLLIILSVVMCAIMLLSTEGIPFWCYLLFPFCVYWFHFIYRIQETKLLSEIERYLELEET
jgi:hypothetical protein